MTYRCLTYAIVFNLFAVAVVADERNDEFREFRDRQGRSVRAKIVRVTGDQLTVQRSDGKQFTAPIVRFSDDDQRFIRQWENHSSATAGTKTDEHNWPRFRGIGGTGRSDETGLPTTWSLNDNLEWFTSLPGPGASSPIIWRDKVFVTCYAGYGISQENPGENVNLMRMLLCIDKAMGRTVWKRLIPSRRNVYFPNFVALHGFASSTPVCDGERVYCFFGNSGVYAFDMDGEPAWDVEIGQKIHGFGTGASPVLHGNLLIVNACVESGSLIALDKKTGREVWRADNIEDAWNTPIFVNANNDRVELILDTKDHLRAFEPLSGRELWKSAGSQPPRYICPSPIAHDGVIYAVHGYHGPLTAVRPGGSGDVSESHRLWTLDRVGSNVPSPVYHDGLLYIAKEDGGVITCVDANSGELVYRERLRPSPRLIYASPLAADGKIYFVSREDGAYVLAAGREFKQLAHNVIQTDDSIFNGSPVVSGGKMFLRSNRFLYCLRKR